MSNKFTIKYQNKQGTELHNWLLENGDSLKNKRIFYVVKANMEKDKDVYKIGISERGDNSAIGRLIDYVHFYGVTNKKNSCQGVKLYLLLANVFNPDVEASHAAVRKLETKVIRDFADKRERGRERIHVSIQELFDYLEENNYITDTEKETRKTPRLAEKEQAAAKAVKKIVSEDKNRRGETLYEVEFMKGFRYDVNEKQIPLQRPNEKLTYEEIVQLPRGKTLLDKYIKKNEKKKEKEPEPQKEDDEPEITTRTTRSGTKVTNLRSKKSPKSKASKQTPNATDAPISSRTRSSGAAVTNI